MQQPHQPQDNIVILKSSFRGGETSKTNDIPLMDAFVPAALIANTRVVRVEDRVPLIILALFEHHDAVFGARVQEVLQDALLEIVQREEGLEKLLARSPPLSSCRPL